MPILYGIQGLTFYFGEGGRFREGRKMFKD